MTTLFETAAVPAAVPMDTPMDAPVARKKHGWLPLLSVLFLISYGLMTMLIVEQGQTIESQRVLIRELFRDSRELSAIKLKNQADAQQAASKVQTPSTQTPSSPTQTQTPSAQAPVNTPSSQAVPQHGTQNTAKPKFELPSKQASDIVDDTRSLITI